GGEFAAGDPPAVVNRAQHHVEEKACAESGFGNDLGLLWLVAAAPRAFLLRGGRRIAEHLELVKWMSVPHRGVRQLIVVRLVQFEMANCLEIVLDVRFL